MNQQPGGGGNGGFPGGGGSINPQALQAALGQAQQQQGQGGNAGMMGMGMGSMNPALLQQQQQQQQQSQPPNSMGGGGGGGGHGGVSGGNDVGSSQQQGNSMIPAGLPPQNAVAMLQALRGNMNNLQGQWSNVASQPDSPAKQQEQTRLATEMKRLKGIHDQLINMLRSQQGQQQQQGARPQQPQGQQQQQQMVRGQQQAPATPTQANAGSPPPQQQQQGPAHQSRPSMQMQDPSAAMQGMPPYGQANAGMAMGQGQGQSQGGQGQGFPGTPGSAGGMGANGMPFGAENPQHQSQLAALQAFAQQQQQRQQQQSQHHGTPQQQHGTPQGMTGTPQMQNQQPPQQQQQGMMPPGPPQQQQQQPPPTPSQAPPLPPGLSNLSQFTAILGSFMTQRGTPFPPNAPMTFVGPAAAAAVPNSNETRPIELNALFAAVVGMGGSARLSSTTVPGTSSNVPQALTGWIILANKLGLAVANPDPQGEGRRDQVPTPAQTPERLRNWYRERLAPFEEWWMNRSKQQQQQQGGGAAAGTPGPGQSNPPTPMQQQAQPQQPQPQRPDGMPGPSSQGYGNQQQMMQGQQQPPQQQQQQQPGARPSAQGPAPPLTPAQQQAIQQLAHQLQRAVAEGKLSSEDARNRFMQAQAAIRGQGAPPQQQQQGGGPMMQGQPSAGPSNEPVQAPTPAASTTSETPDQKGAGKKRPRKSGGQNAAGGGAAANKGAKMPKMEYGGGEGTPTVDTRPASRQGSMQAPGTPAGGMPPSAGPSGMPQMPPQQPQAPQLTPKTAMRMLQQGNLNPAQQAAALAAVRAGSQAQAQAQQQQQQQQSMRPPSSAGTQGPLPPPPFGAHPAAPDGMTDPARQAPQPYQQPPQQMQQQPQQAQAPPQPAPPAPEPHPPNKYKVEYLPLRRDISTHGGWSLSLIDQELTPFTRGYGKQPRSVRELGTVDISGIVFSLKSGLEVEVSWALNTLLVLSSGSGVRYDAFHVGLAHCGDLLEELVGVLERSALVEGEEKVHDVLPPSFDIEGKSTHADWVAESLEAEEEAKLFRRATSFNKRQSSRSSAEEEDEAVTPPSYHAALMEERQKSRKADLAMTVLDILRNFASMQQNVDLLARHTRLLELLGKMVERNNDDASSSSQHVFTRTEHLRIRKDVLFLLSCISGPTLRLPSLPIRTVASLFDLLCSFLVDGASIEELAGLIYDYPPAPPPQQPGMPPPMRPAPVPWAARVPHYAEMALDSFARFAQPDANRRLLSTLIPESTLFHLAQTMVRMLPCSDVDFSLFRTEARLAYTEHIAMCLYNVVFMASSRLKARLRNGTAGWVGAVWRVVKKTARQGQAAAAADGNAGQGQQAGSFTQNPFSALIFRLVETLKLVDEARDLFDQHPSLAFAGQEDSAGGRGGSPGEGEMAVSTRVTGTKKKAPLLALEEMDVVQLLATPGMDPVLVGHLSSMIEG